MATFQDTAADRAGRLGMEIWLSLLPHTDNGAPPCELGTDEAPADAYRLTKVTGTGQLRPGDLILALDNSGGRELRNNRTLAGCTLREAVRAHASAVRRVTRVGGRTITAQLSINIPLGGWGSCDPDRIAEPRWQGAPGDRMNVSAVRWTIVRLGSADEFVEGFRSHKDFAEWRSAYQVVKAQEAADAADRRARIKAQGARRAPLLAAIEEFNTITGEQLLTLGSVGRSLDEVGEVEFAVKWFAGGDRLLTYLAGLLAVGRITNTGYTNAVRQLRTLGLHAGELPDSVPTPTVR
ncbi:hypothetical protein ACF08N_36605 [Streptomyces sp. NPDC015127]|uniref:hypothetical protein n=1 Tax=Streptomyces sp. NPDC015127 TaxID=3364939 RepID=UPI0036FDA1C4